MGNGWNGTKKKAQLGDELKVSTLLPLKDTARLIQARGPLLC